ncbi:hypothetical protein THOM_1109 [Trachipleistophora hominis]|uniref:Uncharacterized protein n=1 Tax=Trachipleistophora hominis TaxID=72359 RepID=L7JYU1_TRAHO|nr:hypothetical protein THOM_1109 [Trachipleistophora hominis]
MVNLHVELENEYKLLKQLLYKSKNQHRRTLIYKKMKELFKKIKKRESMCVIKNVARGLYVLSSSNIVMGHFVGFTYVIMGISAKVYCIADELEIDEIKEKRTNKSDSDEMGNLFGNTGKDDFELL